MLMKRVTVALLAVSALAACGADEPTSPTAPILEHNGAVDLKALWERLLPEAAWTFDAGSARRSQDGTEGAVTHRVRILDPGGGQAKHLDGIQLPQGATKHQVRQYVAQVLGAAIRARRGGPYSSTAPEIEFLGRVGGAHVDVLLEPLQHLERLGPDLYLIEAVGRLADGMHREMVLATLPYAEELIAVVIAKHWTQAAAPILMRVLAKQSRYLDPRWAIAAAEVAGPEHYADLRFQVAEGQSPLEVWKAIRELPGMEPLDAPVEEMWRQATADHHRWSELAVIASHYGHADALEVFARYLRRRPWWWDMFHSLTGYGSWRANRGQVAGAAAWVAAHRDDLVFDHVERRYRVE
jgi:hypothetical protein